MMPCPLCKSTDTEVLREHDSSTGMTSLLHYCKACGCCAPPSAWLQYQRPATPDEQTMGKIRDWLRTWKMVYEGNDIAAERRLSATLWHGSDGRMLASIALTEMEALLEPKPSGTV